MRPRLANRMNYAAAFLKPQHFTETWRLITSQDKTAHSSSPFHHQGLHAHRPLNYSNPSNFSPFVKLQTNSWFLQISLFPSWRFNQSAPRTVNAAPGLAASQKHFSISSCIFFSNMLLQLLLQHPGCTNERHHRSSSITAPINSTRLYVPAATYFHFQYRCSRYRWTRYTCSRYRCSRVFMPIL